MPSFNELRILNLFNLVALPDLDKARRLFKTLLPTLEILLHKVWARLYINDRDTISPHVFPSSVECTVVTAAVTSTGRKFNDSRQTWQCSKL
ncbi:hypothetical protein QCA50_017355 [Cerrena zonata]|uniref:Uncharacterized protein n=1 Tax=Cerrena zonata TaxID=2478898 RepID=A0AAW0FDH3_9APHY